MSGRLYRKLPLRTLLTKTLSPVSTRPIHHTSHLLSSSSPEPSPQKHNFQVSLLGKFVDQLWPVYSLCTACIQPVYSLLYTACIQPVYSLYTACVQPVIYSLYTACIQPVYSLYTACVQPVHSLCTVCVQPVYSLCTPLTFLKLA